MPQITTPLAQVLNPQVQQTGTQTGFLAPAAQAGQTRLSTIQNRKIQAKQEDRAEAKSKFEMMDDKSQQRFKSVALAASELLPSLEKGDIAMTNKLMDLRRQDLISQGLPTEDTDQFQQLVNADPELAKHQARNAIQTAKMAGAIDTPEGSQVPFQFLGTQIIKNSDGKLVNMTQVANRQTGQINVVETPVDGQIVSKNLGETANDVRERKVLTKFQEKSSAFAQKASADAFAQIQPMRETIRLYDEALDILDSGADTGAVASRLVSITDLAVKLDNVQSRLGLNVIRNTTFGSLSEAELKFALSSALPQNLTPKELAKWLEDKRAVQEKMIGYITDSAIYLGQHGNSVAGWMQLKKEEAAAAKAVTKKPEKKAAEEAPTGALSPEEEAEFALLSKEFGGG